MWFRLVRIAAMVAVLMIAAFLLLPVLPHERLAHRMMPAPSRLFARPLVLEVGAPLSREELSEHLRRVGYRRANEANDLKLGEFYPSARRLQLMARPFRYPDGVDSGGFLDLHFDDHGRISSIQRGLDVHVESTLIEPEVIGTLFADEIEDRLLVPLSGIPPLVRKAVLLTEDRRFFWHFGIDPIRIVGAAFTNVQEGEVVEGGSTLTQQLVKNVYLTPERSWRRKISEAWISLWISARYSKLEVLEAYLNQIYLGQDGGHAIHGVGRAARFYFGKDVTELGPAEAALLAGIIQAPSAYSPFRHPERAMKRRNLVLGLMKEARVLTESEYDQARAAPLGIRREKRPSPFASHFVDFVSERLQQRFDTEDLEKDGFEVFTTLDASLQRAAEAALKTSLHELERQYPLLRRPASPLQAALVALDPRSGDILAWVGGRDYALAPFDRAAHARRQPGSVFKAIVAMAALTADLRPPLTLATVLEDAPLAVVVEGKPWSPQNYDGQFRGPVTLRTALEDSLNVPFARLGMEVGLVHVAETARRAGIGGKLRPIPSLSLGAFEWTPLEAAVAYGTFAAGGLRYATRTALAVVKPNGRALPGDPVKADRVFPAVESYLVTHALQGAVRRGTGRRLLQVGVSAPIAGKTGTTNEFRDAWFVGYTPDLVVAVWVGFDDGARVGLPGARAALPLFARFLKSALSTEAQHDFVRPAEIEVVDVHLASGLRASPQCPGSAELFREGTAPRQQACQSSAWPGWLRRVLRPRDRH